MKEIVFNGVTYYPVKVPSGNITAILHFKVVYEGEEDVELPVELPGEVVEPLKDYAPEYDVTNDEMKEWLIENVKPSMRMDMTYFYFDSQEDAMAFKLRWA